MTQGTCNWTNRCAAANTTRKLERERLQLNPIFSLNAKPSTYHENSTGCPAVLLVLLSRWCWLCWSHGCACRSHCAESASAHSCAFHAPASSPVSSVHRRGSSKGQAAEQSFICV